MTTKRELRKGMDLSIDRDMKKVVLLLRVSTNSQDYEYQRNTLTDLCKRNGWEIVKTFENKVSGAKKNEEREEIQELISYVNTHQIRRVVCLEISRMGRNTLEALKVIQILNEHKVSLYVKNYNLETLDSEGRVNPVASLICTILLEVAAMERLTIKERMASGRDQYIERCRREGIKMGRPSTYRKSIDEYKKQYQREFSLIRKGLSLANISAITGTSISTIQKLRIMVKEGRGC